MYLSQLLSVYIIRYYNITLVLFNYYFIQRYSVMNEKYYISLYYKRNFFVYNINFHTSLFV